MTRHESPRGYFAHALYEEMILNDKIYLLTGDLGFGMLDAIRDNFPHRFINCGASEQAMLGIAVGLAQEGKIPFVYTISSFFMRAAETIGLYIHGEQAPVRLVGSGRDGDYKHDGPSHNGMLAQNLIESLDITSYYPKDKEEVPLLVKRMVDENKPQFISLRR